MSNKPTKRPRGRPPGRVLTHEARVLMHPAMWQSLEAAAKQEGKSAADIIRQLIVAYLKRHYK